MSPARECGLSALRPTFGRVSRHGGMVLAWSQDRVGPICRTVEDCAMVFNVIHGVDPKDPSTVMTPFQFDRNIKLVVAAHRRGCRRAEGVRRHAARSWARCRRRSAARPGGGGGGLGVESAAAFDSYVQWKAKELGIDLATLPEPQRGGGAGGGAARGGAAAAARWRGALARRARQAAVPRAARQRRRSRRRAGAVARRGGGGAAMPGSPTGMAALTRWTNGRFPRAFDFIKQQRRRQISHQRRWPSC